MKRNCVVVALFCLTVGFLSAIEVSGNQNGIWSPVNNPYQVVGDVTVPGGMTLQLLPGVIVEVMGNFQITAQGTLQAQGTETDSICFRNGQAAPNALWKGIRLENTTLTSHFSRCYIENGEYGINSINSPAVITNCHFNRNKKGIQSYGIGAANPAPVSITYCRIEYSQENGIFIAQNSNAVVSNNDISNNGVNSSFRAAIQLSNQAAGGSNSPVISFNHIHHNRWQGITAWDLTASNAINPIIHDNIIENNYTGVYLLNASGYLHHNIISDNFIPGNMDSGAGVMVSGAMSQPYFENNTITGNYTGFYITNNARPCLGDLSIYHAWAQGENTIRDNVDALGVMHSVYCHQYPINTNIIKAENNWWDFNDAAGIQSTVNDSQVNPALPTVDFSPFLTTQEPSYIYATVNYDNQLSVTNPRLQLVSEATGAILVEYEILLNQTVTLSMELAEAVYIVALVDVDGSDRILWGVYGNLSEPVAVNIPPGEALEADIYLEGAQPWSYEWIKDSVNENGTVYHRVHHGFFVYGFDYIDWLSRSGDNILLLKHTRPDEPADHTWQLPPDNVWLKVDNLEDGNWWNRLEIVDDAGSILTSRFTYREATGQMETVNGFEYLGGYLLWQRAFTGEFQSQELYLRNGYTINRRYYYQDNLLVSAYERSRQLWQDDGTIYPLFSGNRWRYYQMELQPHPTDLVFQLDTTDPLITGVALFWQAPALGSGNWTSYRVYANNELIGSVPIGQTWFYHDDAPVGTIPILQYWVCAFDGTAESGSTNVVVFMSTGTEPEIPAPASVSIFPNPFRISAGGQLSVHAGFPRVVQGSVAIYNLRGQLVQERSFHGEKDVYLHWDGKDRQGTSCGSGVYLVRVKADGCPDQIRRIMVIK